MQIDFRFCENIIHHFEQAGAWYSHTKSGRFIKGVLTMESNVKIETFDFIADIVRVCTFIKCLAVTLVLRWFNIITKKHTHELIRTFYVVFNDPVFFRIWCNFNEMLLFTFQNTILTQIAITEAERREKKLLQLK